MKHGRIGGEKGKEGRFFNQREAHKARQGMVGSQAWQGQSVLGKGQAGQKS